MKKYSVEEIITGVKHRNNDVFRFLYSEIYPSIKKFILQNKGSDEDARDVFQEALIIFYRNACKKGFKLSSSVKTYLFSVCRNIWLLKLDKTPERIDDIQTLNESELDYNVNEEDKVSIEEIDDSLKLGLIQKHFRKLERFCQRILQMFFKGKSHEEISKKLKISYDASRNRKKICLDKLTELITDDPDYKKFYHS